MKRSVVRTSTTDDPLGGVLRRLTVLGAVLAVLATGACGNTTAATPSQPATSGGGATKAATAVLGADQYLENGADYISTVDWTRAPKLRIDLGEMFFKPKDLAVKSGIPIVLEVINSGKITHEFTADEFFRSSSIRKIQSAQSEVRVPFFTEIEVLAGQTVKVFAIPVIAGKFEMLCRLPGHREAGMEGTITVTGAPTGLPTPVLKSMKSGPWLQNNTELVKAALPTWDAKAKTVNFEAGEGGGGMYFKPKELVLKVGTPHVVRLVNAGAILHQYTADDFFPTVAFRMAKDASGEYKSPLLKEAEVLGGKQLDLYLIPTKVGVFKIVCQLDGHEKAGMVGTIKVTA